MSETIATTAATGAPRVANASENIRRLLRRPAAALALGLLAIIVVTAVAAPLITPYAPNAFDFDARLAGPSSSHWFGTDELGRDLFSRVLYGGRLDLVIAAGGTLVGMGMAIVWGGLAALRGGWIDDGLMRVADVLMAMPALMLALVLAAAFGASGVSLTIIIGVLLSPWAARVIRTAFLTELHLDYCIAARAYGASTRRLLFVEILPNTIGVLVVQAAIVAANVILIEATLSFVGLGVQPPASSWGTLLALGYIHIHEAFWYGVFPGVFIFLTILTLNTLGDHLQAILDPRTHV